MEILIGFWILLSIGIGFLASERGRNPVGWALLALVTSPLLGLIIVLLMRDLKVEAADREREEMRHREQLAAIAGKSNESARIHDADGPQWPRPKPSSPPAATATSPVLVADELEKLANLQDKGVLTPAEFTEQKARLLGNSTGAKPTAPNESPSSIWIPATADLSTFDSCKAALIGAGCRVSNPSDNTWEILDSAGVTRVVRSAQGLKQLAQRYQSS